MSTKTNERRLKITPGIWTAEDSEQSGITNKVLADETTLISVSQPGNIIEVEANTQLIADAGNTANEVDMLPSELLAKLREAERALDIAHRVMLYRDWNRYAEPSLQREAFEAANRIINPHHYTSTT